MNIWRRNESPRRSKLKRGGQVRQRRLVAERLEDRHMMAGNPLTSIPQLNSFAGAPAALYLDFNGHTQGTSVTPVYDADGDATTFSDQELAFIQDVWKVVAEDFAPFNINVSTVQPSLLAPGVPDSSVNGKALRIAIGGTDPSGIGGWGMYNSFTNSQPNVAWVYAQGKTDPRAWGSIVSHEAGHSFGLRHWSAMQYSNDFTWSAIMNSSQIGNAATWHTGTTDLGSVQDDMAMLASSLNRFGYRADDHAGTNSAATPMVGSGATFTGTGIIGTNSDVDVFSLTTSGPRSVRISIEGDALTQNLDAVIELRDASGAIVAIANPTDSMNASIITDTSVVRYIAVKSNGQYGRVGTYSLKVEESLAGIALVSSGGPYTTSESGRSETISLSLKARPTANVTIPISSSNSGEGAVSAASIVFTPTNWFVPQTLRMTGVADEIQDGAVGYAMLLAPAISDDVAYGGVDLADFDFVNLDDAPGHIYWLRSDFSENLATVERSTLAGDGVQTTVNIYSALGATEARYSPLRMVIDPVGGKLYWYDSSSYDIYHANLDGTGAAVLMARTSSPGGLAIDVVSRKLYWTDGTAGKIQRSNLDGSSIEDVVVSGLSSPTYLAVDEVGGKVYWSDSVNFTISRANLDGTNVEVVVAAAANDRPGSIAIDSAGGKMYFSLRGSYAYNRLHRSNLDGSELEQLLDLNELDPTVANPVVQTLVLDLDGGRMFWSDSLGNRLYSAELDGSNPAVVIDGLLGFRGMAFLPAIPGVTVTPQSGLTTTEAGGTANFTVVLNAPPTADVVIPVSTSDSTEGTVSTPTLTFTSMNWDMPQTVTVRGVDDSVYDQDIAYTIVLGAAVSSDARYHGMNAADVSAVNRDNDPAPTKFYVVNDATQNQTYEYNAGGGLVESYNINSGNTAPRGAASTAVGDKIWVIDDNRKVFVYNTSGGLLGSWTAATLATNATPEGIATNGTDIWIVDSQSDKVYRYTGAATRLSGTQNAASNFALNTSNKDAKDIVTDGQSLWVVNDSSTDKVFKYTVAGSLLGTWTIDSANRAPTGITIDPASPSHVWIVDGGTDRIYQYNAAVGRTSGSQSATLSFALAAGNTNPQGIADPPTKNEARREAKPFSNFTLAAGNHVTSKSAPKVATSHSTVTAAVAKNLTAAIARDTVFELLSTARLDVPLDRLGQLCESDFTPEVLSMAELSERVFSDFEYSSMT